MLGSFFFCLWVSPTKLCLTFFSYVCDHCCGSKVAVTSCSSHSHQRFVSETSIRGFIIFRSNIFLESPVNSLDRRARKPNHAEERGTFYMFPCASTVHSSFAMITTNTPLLHQAAPHLTVNPRRPASTAIKTRWARCVCARRRSVGLQTRMRAADTDLTERHLFGCCSYMIRGLIH